MFNIGHIQEIQLNEGFMWATVLFSLALFALTAFLTVKTYKKKISVGTESMIGDTGHIVEWKNNKGRIRVQGEIWHAVSDEKLDLKKDDKVLISAIEDLNLKIKIIE